MIYYESELKHHGVKGQKWGVRKDKPSNSASKKKLKDAVTDKDRDRIRRVSRKAERLVIGVSGLNAAVSLASASPVVASGLAAAGPALAVLVIGGTAVRQLDMTVNS